MGCVRTCCVIAARVKCCNVLVTRVDGYVHREQLQGGLDSLESVDARLLGLVLTRVPNQRGTYYAYQYAYQSDAVEPTSSRRAKGGGRGSAGSEDPNGHEALTDMRSR